MNFALAVKTIDGRDAPAQSNIGYFGQRNQGPCGIHDTECLQIANGLTIALIESHPNAHLIAPFLQPLRFRSEEALADLVHEGSMRKAELERPRLQFNFHLLHAFLVVVGNVLQVIAVQHGRFELLRCLAQRIQVIPQQRNRNRSAER